MEYVSKKQIAKLVLGYLKDEKCKKAFQYLLRSSSHLRGYFHKVKKGKPIRTRVCGMNLIDIITEYSTIYRIVQERLEATNFFNCTHGKSSLEEQLIYLLNRVQYSPPSSPCSINSKSSSDRELSSFELTRHHYSKSSAKENTLSDCLSLHKTDVVCNNDINTTHSTNLPGHSSNKSTESIKSTGSSNYKKQRQDDLEIPQLVSKKLIRNREFHEKLAENINKEVVTIRHSPEERHNVVNQELDNVIKSIVQKTESDPIFNKLLSEIIDSIEHENPIESSQTESPTENDQRIESGTTSEDLRNNPVPIHNPDRNKTNLISGDSDVNSTISNEIISSSTNNQTFLPPVSLSNVLTVQTESLACPPTIQDKPNQQLSFPQTNEVPKTQKSNECNNIKSPTPSIAQPLMAQTGQNKGASNTGGLLMMQQSTPATNANILDVSKSYYVLGRQQFVSLAPKPVSNVTIPLNEQDIMSMPTVFLCDNNQSIGNQQVPIIPPIVSSQPVQSSILTLPSSVLPTTQMSKMSNKHMPSLVDAPISKASYVPKKLKTIAPKILPSSNSKLLQNIIITTTTTTTRYEEKDPSMAVTDTKTETTREEKSIVGNKIVEEPITKSAEKPITEQTKEPISKQTEEPITKKSDEQIIKPGEEPKQETPVTSMDKSSTIKKTTPKSSSHVRQLNFSSPEKLIPAKKKCKEPLNFGTLEDEKKEKDEARDEYFKSKQLISGPKSWDTQLRALSGFLNTQEEPSEKKTKRPVTKRKRTDSTNTNNSKKTPSEKGTTKSSKKRRNSAISTSTDLLETSKPNPESTADSLKSSKENEEDKDSNLKETKINKTNEEVQEPPATEPMEANNFQPRTAICEKEDSLTSLSDCVIINRDIKPTYRKKCNIESSKRFGAVEKVVTCSIIASSNKSSMESGPIDEISPTLILSPTKLNANKRSIVEVDNKEDDMIETPTDTGGDRLVCSTSLTAKRNITPDLETPHKKGIVPKTPNFLSPVNTLDTPFTKVLKEQLQGFDLSVFPTPKFPLTPNLAITPAANEPSPYSQRSTDYSTSSSYYQPSDTEQSRSIEQLLIEEGLRLEKSAQTEHKKDPDNPVITSHFSQKSINDRKKNFNYLVTGKKNLSLIKNSMNDDNISETLSSDASMSPSSNDSSLGWIENHTEDTIIVKEMPYSLRSRGTVEEEKNENKSVKNESPNNADNIGNNKISGAAKKITAPLKKSYLLQSLEEKRKSVIEKLKEEDEKMKQNKHKASQKGKVNRMVSKKTTSRKRHVTVDPKNNTAAGQQEFQKEEVKDLVLEPLKEQEEKKTHEEKSAMENSKVIIHSDIRVVAKKVIPDITKTNVDEAKNEKTESVIPKANQIETKQRNNKIKTEASKGEDKDHPEMASQKSNKKQTKGKSKTKTESASRKSVRQETKKEEGKIEAEVVNLKSTKKEEKKAETTKIEAINEEKKAESEVTYTESSKVKEKSEEKKLKAEILHSKSTDAKREENEAGTEPTGPKSTKTDTKKDESNVKTETTLKSIKTEAKNEELKAETKVLSSKSSKSEVKNEGRNTTKTEAKKEEKKSEIITPKSKKTETRKEENKIIEPNKKEPIIRKNNSKRSINPINRYSPIDEIILHLSSDESEDSCEKNIRGIKSKKDSSSSVEPTSRLLEPFELVQTQLQEFNSENDKNKLEHEMNILHGLLSAKENDTETLVKELKERGIHLMPKKKVDNKGSTSKVTTENMSIDIQTKSNSKSKPKSSELSILDEGKILNDSKLKPKKKNDSSGKRSPSQKKDNKYVSTKPEAKKSDKHPGDKAERKTKIESEVTISKSSGESSKNVQSISKQPIEDTKSESSGLKTNCFMENQLHIDLNISCDDSIIEFDTKMYDTETLHLIHDENSSPPKKKYDLEILKKTISANVYIEEIDSEVEKEMSCTPCQIILDIPSTVNILYPRKKPKFQTKNETPLERLYGELVKNSSDQSTQSSSPLDDLYSPVKTGLYNKKPDVKINSTDKHTKCEGSKEMSHVSKGEDKGSRKVTEAKEQKRGKTTTERNSDGGGRSENIEDGKNEKPMMREKQMNATTKTVEIPELPDDEIEMTDGVFTISATEKSTFSIDPNDELMNYAIVGSSRIENDDATEFSERKRKLGVDLEDRREEKKLKTDNCQELLKKIDVDSFLKKVHANG